MGSGFIRSVRRVQERVPMDECIKRALAYGKKQTGLMPASWFATAIWPGAKFIAPQGAGAAASRVLRVMQKRGLAKWRSTHGSDGRATSWGWITTENETRLRRTRIDDANRRARETLAKVTTDTCVCGDHVDEHGGDRKYPGSTACRGCDDCIAYEAAA